MSKRLTEETEAIKVPAMSFVLTTPIWETLPEDVRARFEPLLDKHVTLVGTRPNDR